MTQHTLPTDTTTHYQDLVDAQAIHTDATNRLAKLETALLDDYMKSVEDHRQEYTSLQDAIAKSEEVIKGIALQHPEWFVAAKTLTTLFGSVQSRKSTKLEVPNADVSIALLQQLGPDAAPFLRCEITLNLEALESLTDDELKRVRIKRVTSESLTVKPTKPNLGRPARAGGKKPKKVKKVRESEEPQTA